jgi:hypothetical protein
LFRDVKSAGFVVCASWLLNVLLSRGSVGFQGDAGGSVPLGAVATATPDRASNSSVSCNILAFPHAKLVLVGYSMFCSVINSELGRGAVVVFLRCQHREIKDILLLQISSKLVSISYNLNGNITGLLIVDWY